MSSRSLRMVAIQLLWLSSDFCMDLEKVSLCSFPLGRTTNFVRISRLNVVSKRTTKPRFGRTGALTLRRIGKRSYCNLQKDYLAGVVPVRSRIAGSYSCFVKDIPGHNPPCYHCSRCQKSHFRGKSPRPLWYHPPQTLTDSGYPRTRRVIGIARAVIGSESFVCDQCTEVFEFQPWLHLSHARITSVSKSGQMSKEKSFRLLKRVGSLDRRLRSDFARLIVCHLYIPHLSLNLEYILSNGSRNSYYFRWGNFACLPPKSV
jgi:hypothetical protein